MNEARLEQWKVVQDFLVGKVYGHPSFPDGTEIITSRVARWDLEKQKARTVGRTEYTLGEPAPGE